MENHKPDCKCPPCRYRRAGQGPKEIISLRVSAETMEKLQKLMALYNRDRASIVREALDLLAARQGY